MDEECWILLLHLMVQRLIRLIQKVLYLSVFEIHMTTSDLMMQDFKLYIMISIKI